MTVFTNTSGYSANTATGGEWLKSRRGGILPISDGMDMSIPARVRAWELGEPIARPLVVDLTKLDRELEKEAMQ